MGIATDSPGTKRDRAVIASLVLMLFVFCGPVSAEFPVAVGNPQRSVYVAASGPRQKPEVLWERGLGVRGFSDTQPILDAEGNLYVTASPENQKSWTFSEQPRGTLVSLDPQGAVRWRYDWTWDAKRQNTWSHLTGPILLKQDLIAMGSRFGWLRCWNRNTGNLIWEQRLTPGNDPITSTPMADNDGNIYVHVRDVPTLRKVDGATGQYLWIHRFGDGSIGNTSSPTLSADQKTVYIGRTTRDVGYLYAINTDVGSLKWAWSPEKARGHSFAWGIPILDRQGTIYLQDEEFAALYAVRDLGQVHQFQWSYKPTGKGLPRLAAVNEEAYFSSYNSPAPVVFSVTHAGVERWSRKFEKGNSIGGMLVTQDTLYFGVNGTGRVFAMDAKTGEILWQKQVGRPDAGFSEGLTLNKKGILYVPVSATDAHPDEPSVVALKGR
ncbi:MAG: PQQ-binding-like beta-propeller repeat protein [Planctomycetales bacterium]